MQKGDYTMTNEERESIRKYVLEVFHYEHQLSATILAKLLNVVELLIDKGYINEYEAMACLSDVAIANWSLKENILITTKTQSTYSMKTCNG